MREGGGVGRQGQGSSHWGRLALTLASVGSSSCSCSSCSRCCRSQANRGEFGEDEKKGQKEITLKLDIDEKKRGELYKSFLMNAMSGERSKGGSALSLMLVRAGGVLQSVSWQRGLVDSEGLDTHGSKP